MKQLIGFGYWRSIYEPALPDPAWFVDPTWPATERQQVAAYLSQGHAFQQWMGFSWCRFRCGISEGAMGAADLTDGTYCWPAGLAHYVRAHELRLPDSVVRHMLNQPSFPAVTAQRVSPMSDPSLDWWREQSGWQPFSKSFLTGDDQQAKDFTRRYDRGQLSFKNYSEDELRATIQAANELKTSLPR